MRHLDTESFTKRWSSLISLPRLRHRKRNSQNSSPSQLVLQPSETLGGLHVDVSDNPSIEPLSLDAVTAQGEETLHRASAAGALPEAMSSSSTLLRIAPFLRPDLWTKRSSSNLSDSRRSSQPRSKHNSDTVAAEQGTGLAVAHEPILRPTCILNAADSDPDSDVAGSQRRTTYRNSVVFAEVVSPGNPHAADAQEMVNSDRTSIGTLPSRAVPKQRKPLPTPPLDPGFLRITLSLLHHLHCVEQPPAGNNTEEQNHSWTKSLEADLLHAVQELVSIRDGIPAEHGRNKALIYIDDEFEKLNRALRDIVPSIRTICSSSDSGSTQNIAQSFFDVWYGALRADHDPHLHVQQGEGTEPSPCLSPVRERAEELARHSMTGLMLTVEAEKTRLLEERQHAWSSRCVFRG